MANQINFAGLPADITGAVVDSKGNIVDWTINQPMTDAGSFDVSVASTGANKAFDIRFYNFVERGNDNG